MLKKTVQAFITLLMISLLATVALADDLGRTIKFSEGSVQTAAPEIDIILDGSFEGGTPNASWTEGSTNFGTPLCDEFGCGTGGGTTGPRTGAWWAWFGGIDAPEVGSVEQTIMMSPGNTGVLSFWLWNGASGNIGVDDFTVMMDGTMIFQVLDGDAAYTAGYTEVVLDVSAYADGAAHTLRFEATTSATGGTTNFSLDDVVLDENTPTDVSLTSFGTDASSSFATLGLLILMPVLLGGAYVLRRRQLNLTD